MKPVEELKISHAPWRVNPIDNDFVEDANGLNVCQVKWISGDAHLIAAAPELYKALYDDVTFYCEHCLGVHNATECPQKSIGTCKIMEWRKLLEKAGGAK